MFFINQLVNQSVSSLKDDIDIQSIYLARKKIEECRKHIMLIVDGMSSDMSSELLDICERWIDQYVDEIDKCIVFIKD